jgi:hypothetical protein
MPARSRSFQLEIQSPPIQRVARRSPPVSETQAAFLANEPSSSTPIASQSVIQRAKSAPLSLSAIDIIQLQRTIGNRAVAQLLRPTSGPMTASAGATVQREVKKIWGKWKSSYDMSRDFASEAEALVFDNAKKAEATAAKQAADAAAAAQAEDTWMAAAEAAAWKYSDTNKRLSTHFTDGWGAAYGITSVAQIAKAIIDGQGSEEIGNQEVYLGNFTVRGVTKGCNILYQNKMVSITAGGITRNTLQSDVYHCGPSLGAG